MGSADEVLSSLTTGVVGIDYDERVGMFNTGAAHTLGVSPDDVLGRPVRDLVTAPAPIGSLAHVIVAEGLGAHAQTGHSHLEIETSEGRRTIGYRLHVMGETWMVLMLFDDISETIALERRGAEDRTAGDIGRMAGTIAHDLKTPLATIALYGRLAADEIGDDHPVAQRLQVIQEQVDECRQRLSGFLTLARGHAGVSTVALCEPGAIVAAVVDERRQQHPDAAILYEAAGNACRALLSEREYTSIVSNLVGNAVDVTPDGAAIEVVCEAGNGWFELNVLDRGPGLPDRDIFSPFSSTKSKGTGMGLWLARRAVERAAGAIAAGDRPGGGAVLTVRLPCADVERLRQRRFLVVDDDEQLRRGLVETLEKGGTLVTESASAEGVEAGGVGLDEFDALILDYRLLGRTGLELAREAPPTTPVVMISGDPDIGPAMDGAPANLRLLLKPFDALELLEALSILIRGVSV